MPPRAVENQIDQMNHMSEFEVEQYIETFDEIYEKELLRNTDVTDSKLYIGIPSFDAQYNVNLLASRVSPHTLFDYDNDDIMEYLVENSITYSDATPVSPEIMQVHTDDSYAYHVVLKTHWLRLVQRCWKKIINNRRRIIQNPAYVRSRELRGNNEANLPGLRGMLSCMK
jgi:hypothetical protein